MTLESTAQHIEVLELPLTEGHLVFEPDPSMTLELEESPEGLAEIGDLELKEMPDEIEEPEAHEFTVGELPGVDQLDPDFEKELEVSEDDGKKEDKAEVKDKPMLKWDWEARWKKDGAKGFFAWAKEILDSIPRHSGKDEAGLHRATAYLERFCDEVAKAMKKDLDGELDADKIEKMCAEAEDGIERLHARLDKIKKKKSTKKTKKAEEELEMIKIAQKTPNIMGIVITVPLFISRIARVIVNGMVSAGHDAEVLFDEQVKKYKLNEREQAELMMHLFDMNVPMRQDRYYLRGEESRMEEGKGDWMSNYPG